jgi:riboflavin kinase / FMN adenylyltransferase
MMHMAIEVLSWEKLPPSDCRDGALTIGNFDGVHLGHAALLSELRRQANAVTGPAVALTFDPHPLQLLRPERFQPVLTTPTDRAELLQANGADHVILLQTTPALLALTADDFFARVVRDGFQVRALVEGENFGFGRNREGNVDKLRSLSSQAKIGFVIVPPVQRGGKPISSSRVRDALLRGDVREAAALTGRLYRLRGTVGPGQRRGQTLGFPTANLVRPETLVPGDGVYAVRVQHEGKTWPGAANIGPNPTFGEQARKLEVHLIGFQGDLYGRSLAVDFADRLRDTRSFAGAAELVEQLRQDVEQARRLIEGIR